MPVLFRDLSPAELHWNWKKKHKFILCVAEFCVKYRFISKAFMAGLDRLILAPSTKALTRCNVMETVNGQTSTGLSKRPKKKKRLHGTTHPPFLGQALRWTTKQVLQHLSSVHHHPKGCLSTSSHYFFFRFILFLFVHVNGLPFCPPVGSSGALCRQRSKQLPFAHFFFFLDYLASPQVMLLDGRQCHRTSLKMKWRSGGSRKQHRRRRCPRNSLKHNDIGLPGHQLLFPHLDQNQLLVLSHTHLYLKRNQEHTVVLINESSSRGFLHFAP